MFIYIVYAGSVIGGKGSNSLTSRIKSEVDYYGTSRNNTGATVYGYAGNRAYRFEPGEKIYNARQYDRFEINGGDVTGPRSNRGSSIGNYLRSGRGIRRRGR